MIRRWLQWSIIMANALLSALHWCTRKHLNRTYGKDLSINNMGQKGFLVFFQKPHLYLSRFLAGMWNNWHEGKPADMTLRANGVWRIPQGYQWEDVKMGHYRVLNRSWWLPYKNQPFEKQIIIIISVVYNRTSEVQACIFASYVLMMGDNMQILHNATTQLYHPVYINC